MLSLLHSRQKSLPAKILHVFITLTFLFSFAVPPSTVSAQTLPQSILNLPLPGTMLHVSPGYIPAHVKGITLDPENPLQFDFIIDKGQSELSGDAFEEEGLKLIKYFLAALTVPEEELWVNLSPYESDRIIPEAFSTTEMGRDLLAQDYLLKQLTASLMYPEDELGQKFWDRVYAKAHQQFGTTDIPLDTFNKVWIVPENATIYETGANAFIVKSRLKVMLEEDYVAVQRNLEGSRMFEENNQRSEVQEIRTVTKDMIREVLIPEIEKEVNEGENFANLRQIYNSLILAAWYKRNLKQSLLGQVYVDQNKVVGINDADREDKQRIYEQYLDAFEKGVYNYIRQEADPYINEIIPRKYFSGGALFDRAMMNQAITSIRGERALLPQAQRELVDAAMRPAAPGGEIRDFAFNVNLLENMNAGQLASARGFDRAITSAPLSLTRRSASTFIDDDIDFTITQSDAYFDQVDQAMRAPAFVYKGYQNYSQQKEWIAQVEAIANKKPSGLSPTTKYSSAIEEAIDVGKIGIEPPAVYVVETSGPQSGFDALYSPDSDAIYIEKNFADKIEERGNPFGMRTRFFLNLLTPGTEVEKREAEYRYLMRNHEIALGQKLPEVFADNTFDDILEEVENNNLGLWMENRNENDLRQQLGLSEDVTFVNQTSKFRRHTNQLRDIAKLSVYNLAINLANEEADYNKFFRYSEDDPEIPTDVKEVVAGILPFAANPITGAHHLVTLLQAMAVSGADVYAASPTKGDFRKPALEATYKIRLALAEKFLDKTTKGLIKVMPALAEEKVKGGVNGEEKIISLIALNKALKKITFLYGAGEDHYYSFAREKADKKTIKYSKITKNNEKDFMYYVNLKGYKELLKKLVEVEFEAISGEFAGISTKNKEEEEVEAEKQAVTNRRQAFIQELIKADRKEWPAIFDKIKSDPTQDFELPVLDTVGKLFIIQQEYVGEEGKSPAQEVEIVMLNSLRGGEQASPDKLRDTLGIKTIFNEGADFEISATMLRNAIVKLATTKEFDFELFESMPVDLLTTILKPENREYLYSLLRIKGFNYSSAMELSNAIDALFPANVQRQQQRKEALISQLEADLTAKLGRGVVVTDQPIPGRSESEISLSIARDDTKRGEPSAPVLSYRYSVRNAITSKAGGLNTILTKGWEFSADPFDLQQQRNILSAVQNYAAQYNASNVDIEKPVDIDKKAPAEVLIQRFPTLVAGDVASNELSSKSNIGVIALSGNLDLNTFQQALELKHRGVSDIILISGGKTKLVSELKKLAQGQGYDIQESSNTEASVVRDIMIGMATKNPTWRGLVADLNDPNKTILEERSRYRMENFELIKTALMEKGLLKPAAKKPKKLRMLNIQPDYENLRSRGIFNSVFKEEIAAGAIEGLSLNPSVIVQNNDVEQVIVGELSRVVANAQRVNGAGPGWQMPEGFAFVDDAEWAQAAEVFRSIPVGKRRELRSKLQTTMQGFISQEDFNKDLSASVKNFVKVVFEEDIKDKAMTTDAAMNMANQIDISLDQQELKKIKEDLLGALPENKRSAAQRVLEEAYPSEIESVYGFGNDPEALTTIRGDFFLNGFANTVGMTPEELMGTLDSVNNRFLNEIASVPMPVNVRQEQERITNRFEMLKREDELLTSQLNKQGLSEEEITRRPEMQRIVREERQLMTYQELLKKDYSGERVVMTNILPQYVTQVRANLYSADRVSGVQRQSEVDSAMGAPRAAQKVENVGGIDLNPDMLDLQIKRDENGIPLPVFDQPLNDMQIDGFLPVIINITPVPSIPLMLGIADFPEEDVDYSDSGDLPFDRKARLTDLLEISA